VRERHATPAQACENLRHAANVSARCESQQW
jgi:hypothetical protein